MSFQTITYTLAAGVATIALNRPEVMNALSRQMRAELLQAVQRSAAEAQARAAGKSVSVCGEMAGDPAFTDLLLAMGLRSFSMHPSQIPSVKQRVLRIDAARLAALLPEVLFSEDPQREAQSVFVAQKDISALH